MSTLRETETLYHKLLDESEAQMMGLEALWAKGASPELDAAFDEFDRLHGLVMTAKRAYYDAQRAEIIRRNESARRYREVSR